MAVAREELDVLVYPDLGMDSLTYFMSFARLAPVQVNAYVVEGSLWAVRLSHAVAWLARVSDTGEIPRTYVLHVLGGAGHPGRSASLHQALAASRNFLFPQ